MGTEESPTPDLEFEFDEGFGEIDQQSTELCRAYIFLKHQE